MKNDSAQDDPQLDQLKQGMRASWMAGDFGQVAKYTADEGATFISRLPINAEADVLDVACGTGNLAVPAARSGARVAGVDIASNLIEQARERTAAENLTIDFRVGDAEALPFPDASFDVVVTMFGAMFAPRPQLVAAELARVCRPGGMIAMANWTPEGFVGKSFAVTGRVAPLQRRFRGRSCGAGKMWQRNDSLRSAAPSRPSGVLCSSNIRSGPRAWCNSFASILVPPRSRFPGSIPRDRLRWRPNWKNCGGTITKGRRMNHT